MSAHCCPGLTMDADRISVRLPDGTWKATQTIGSIFGSEVHGECSGKGATREEAEAALRTNIGNLYESLWA